MSVLGLRAVNTVETLEDLAARATAITMGTDTTTNANELHDAANVLWKEIANHPQELLPAVTAVAQKLKALLDKAPASAKEALAAYEEAAGAAKFDWIEPPRVVAGFVFLDALERIRSYCASK